MSTTQTLILGAIAGFTIFVGLPMGRVRNTSPRCAPRCARSRPGFSSSSSGTSSRTASSPSSPISRRTTWAPLRRLRRAVRLGFTLGLDEPRLLRRWLKNEARDAARRPRRRRRRRVRAPLVVRLADARPPARAPDRTGIGLHNFGEGLAIGQSAAAGELTLALVLIIGFGLHNTTEGFGIVGPMAGEAELPSWGFLALMGLIGGGPTFLGTLIGRPGSARRSRSSSSRSPAARSSTSSSSSSRSASASRMPRLVSWLLLLGLLLGFGTDWVLVAAGGAPERRHRDRAVLDRLACGAPWSAFLPRSRGLLPPPRRRGLGLPLARARLPRRASSSSGAVAWRAIVQAAYPNRAFKLRSALRRLRRGRRRELDRAGARRRPREAVPRQAPHARARATRRSPRR